MKKLPGNMTVRLADGVPHTTHKRVVSMSCGFDDFKSIDKFLVINMGGKVDCIFGMPWLRMYRPVIDWIGRSVKAKDLDVNEVCAHLAQPKCSWLAVTAVDPTITESSQRATDGPLCFFC